MTVIISSWTLIVYGDSTVYNSGCNMFSHRHGALVSFYLCSSRSLFVVGVLHFYVAVGHSILLHAFCCIAKLTIVRIVQSVVLRRLVFYT